MLGALDGLRVIDLTRHLPGPYCTMLLGDLGADVVKIEEPPVGDPTRAVPPAVGDDSAVHAALNRNKRSVMLDLRKEEGASIVRRLAATADVLVEGFRPGVLARHGLGAQELNAANPRLVYCSVTGYGQEGPHSGRAGHDVNYAARAGLLSPGPHRTPSLPSAQLADMAGAFSAVIGILAALQARERTGRGQVVDVALLRSALSLMALPSARVLAGGSTALEELAGSYACYNVYACRDGRYLAVGALEPKFWERLCRALGLPDLAGRQWERPDRRGQTIEAVAHAFLARDRDEWLRALAAEDVCVEPVLSLAETLGQPEVAPWIVEREGQGATVRSLGTPFGLSATPPSVRRRAPAPGEHADEVLAEAGYGGDAIAALRETGVIA